MRTRFQHPVRQPLDQVAVLGQADEVARHHQAPLGMLPANQRLCPDPAPALEVVERLVVQPQLTPLDRLGQGFARVVAPACERKATSVASSAASIGQRARFHQRAANQPYPAVTTGRSDRAPPTRPR
jgi:hypothetical protein